MVVKIHNDTWRIKLIGGNKKKMNPDQEHYYLGLTEYGTLTINIRKGLPESVARSTIIHELVHAFRFSYAHVIVDEEAMCDFFGAHADEIIALTNQIMKEVIIGADKRRD